MARKPTDKQLFKMKNEWLGQFYEEVKPKDFYRAVFPEGSFEREGHPEDEKCNGVLTVIEGEKARNYIVFDELNMVDEVKGAEFAIMSPVGYSGRNRTAKNASLYDIRYVSVVVCFIAFFANDIYGFVSWRKMKTRQQEITNVVSIM